MRFYSTNNRSELVSLRQAVFQGLPPDNGLYMPENIPNLSPSFLDTINRHSFQEIAKEVIGEFVEGEIGSRSLDELVEDAFNFNIHIRSLDSGLDVVELFHGPTLAFKDFGARFMARLIGILLENENRTIDILVATSGDTGSAVGHGFLGVDGTKVTLLYPKGKVSLIQERQLTTIGGNVQALEVNGTFDDCQRLVKQAFLDRDLKGSLKMTSANSINIARLIPQSLYYCYAFSRVADRGKPVVISVPSGNFGNLCGGLIAKQMGIQIDHFIAATNVNHVVPDYLRSGNFQPKPSIATISNAMDVGNPSNFARIQDIFDNDYEAIRGEISGSWYDDVQVQESMREVFDRHGYLMCPHTAIGYRALKEHTQDGSKSGVFLSTAHPAKFKDVVEDVTGAKVVLPPNLKQAMQKDKRATHIESSLNSLKDYLLNR